MVRDPSDPLFAEEREQLILEHIHGEKLAREHARRKRKNAQKRILARENTWVREVTVRLVSRAKSRARSRQLEFDLTTDYVAGLIEDGKYRCALSGLPFDIAANTEGDYWRNPYMPSLDRITSRGGYTKDNVRVILSALNTAINEWGLEEYMRIAQQVIIRNAKL